jgi:hypothetical protein
MNESMVELVEVCRDGDGWHSKVEEGMIRLVEQSIWSM